MRTVEELQEFYNSMRGEFDEEWRVSINLEDIWVMLDQVAALQAQNAALQARVDALGEFVGEAEVITGAWESQPNPNNGFKIPFREMTALFNALEQIRELIDGQVEAAAESE